MSIIISILCKKNSLEIYSYFLSEGSINNKERIKSQT